MKSSRTWISIHAPREGGDLNKVILVSQSTAISIHAPREGGDTNIIKACPNITISIHAPREGGDRRSSSTAVTTSLFQSTPPARGATSSLIM